MRARFSTTARPSLSLGEARIAVANWLLARHEGGQFALQIGDAASAPGVGRHVAAVCRDLRWLGLDWDGGPALRSERRARYKEVAAQLVARGGAVVSPDGIALAPSLAGQRPAGDPARVWRLIDAEGRPTPLLAQVVDDRDMGVTHVLDEGQEAGGAAPYGALSRALGWVPPQLVSLPPLSDGGLDPQIPLSALRCEGYLGAAVASVLARLVWSPRGRRRLRTLSELAERFEPARLRRGTAPAAQAELDWFNRRALEELDRRQLAAMLAVRWQRAYGMPDRAEGTGLAPAEWRRVLAAAISASHTLAAAVPAARFAFDDVLALEPDGIEALARPFAPRVLRAFAGGIVSVDPFTFEAIDAFVSALRWEYKDRLGVRSRDVMHVIRAALTGGAAGPCLVAACQVLGPRRSASRARQALERRRG